MKLASAGAHAGGNWRALCLQYIPLYIDESKQPQGLALDPRLQTLVWQSVYTARRALIAIEVPEFLTVFPFY